MPLTPGSAQLPLVPNKQWLYISDPFTDGLVTGPNATALQESLFCYAHAQGYTGLIMYEMSNFISGGVLTNSTAWVTFINAAAAKGLEVGAAFGGPSVLNAVIAWNNSNTAKFKMVISEIEWWNYSSNLPFQEPGLTGTYSFFDSLQMFKNYKPQLSGAGLELYTYNGFTKAYQEEYNSGFDVTGVSTTSNTLTIRGNFTSSGSDSIVGGKMFEANQIIRIDNWPVQKNHTFYKLDATTPVTLVGGFTQLKVGQAKQYSGIDDDVTGTTLLSSFTGIPNVSSIDPNQGYRTFTTFTVTSGIVDIPVSSTPFTITEDTIISISNAGPLTVLNNPIIATVRTLSTSSLLKITSPTINNITFKSATGGTTTITTSGTHSLSAGNSILISGLGTGFDGTWTIASVPSATSFTISNGNPGLSVPVTPDAGSYRVMSGTFSTPSGRLIPNNFANAKVRVEFEVTSIAPYTVIPALGFTTVKLRGDKTFMFSPTSTVGSVNWFRSTAGVFKWSGGISGLKVIPGTGGMSGITPTYNAGTNETTFYIAGTFTGTAFDAGFLYGMVNFDVCYSAGGSYDNTPTYPYVSLGSELEQCSAYVDVFGLHDYVQTRPSYGYVQPRVLELGQAGASATNPDIKVTWIISAEPTYLQSFFIGNPGSGVPRKNPIDAYKYIGYPIVPAPNPPQSTSPVNVISIEPNVNVQNEVFVDGVIIFEDTDIRPVTTGNGPNVWVDAGTDISITATAGTELLSGYYCDDCLPTNNCTYSWSVISSNPPGAGTVTPTTSTPISGCPGNTIPGTFNYTSPGIYTVRLTVNDNSGVSPTVVGQDDLTVTVSPVGSGPFDITINAEDFPTCSQSNNLGLTTDGQLSASIPGAQGPVKPVTFTWTKNGSFYTTTTDNTGAPQAVSVISGLTVGVYEVTAVDSSTPPRSGTQTYTLNSTYDVNANSNIFWTDPECYGYATGTVNLTFGPGFAPCGLGGPTISWSNGASGVSSLTSLSAGSYTASITDCVGCTGVKTAVIVDPPPIIPTISGVNTTCGYNNGSATVDSVSGGTPPYTYAWSNGDTNLTTFNLAPGAYSVTVTDSLGCVGVSFSIGIASSVGPTISISGPSEVCCNQEATFTASVTAPGPYTIIWSNLSVGPTANYTFTDCNAKFGSVSATITLNDPPFCSATAVFGFDINFDTNPVTNIKVLSGDSNNLTSCLGDAVVLGIIGGNGSGSWNFGSPANTSNPLTVDQAWFNLYGTPGQPFEFIWSQVDVLTGCYSQASIIVNYPIGVEVEVEVIPVFCGGPIDGGGIDLTILASCGDPYIITWTGPVSGTDTTSSFNYSITNLTDGTYDVTVEDAQGNIWNNSAVVVFTSVPEITNAVITNYCFNTPVGSNDGAINITVTGGTPPYTYLWTRTGDLGFLETTQDISNLSLGEYNVEVTDDNGCTTTESYVIEYSDPIDINITVASSSCWGLCNGAAEIEISGGVAPYTLTLNGQDPYILSAPGTAIFSNLCATTYTLDVVDADGCTANEEFDAAASASVNITQFTTRTVDPSSPTAQDGAIYIDLISGGGGPPYDYLWTGPNGFTATTQDITNLAPGDYQVTIKTVVFGVPQPTCAVTRKFKLQTSCVEFSLEELKVMLFKFQCCAGVLAKEYVQYQEIGRPDLAECKLIDLKYLTLAINTLSCINELPDACLSCEDISNILNQIKKICDCDCCDDAATGVYNVTYNPFTGQLDSN